ncbi:MAG: hypothetical protein K9N06_09990 [Candidatus Cloacimonetes bacterium]|nr:hypothetical protein [Candidatus Cloacimonadota bacterium]
MTKIKAGEFSKGLSVNRNKDYIQQIPHYRFTKYGKLANSTAVDMSWTVQLLNEHEHIKGKNYSGGELKAIISITEMSSQVIRNFSRRAGRDVMAELVVYLQKTMGNEKFLGFQQDYISSFLHLEIDGDFSANSSYVTEDVLLNWLNNINLSFSRYNTLFDNQTLVKDPHNLIFIQEIVGFLQKQVEKTDLNPVEQHSLYSLLREPAERFRDSIFDQLEFIIEFWREYLDDESLLLQALDLLREERKTFLGGPGDIKAIEYGQPGLQGDEEYYSLDQDWMPSLVLLAKSAYVWLHQLSLKYGKIIRFLNEIPEAEFALLHSRGITGLWLIGIWQRSPASEKIKRMNGDLHVIASAYALDSYRIADDLGGDNAWDILTQKAARYGIRLGCDMVPNHTGIDAQWLVHHPHWYIQRENIPFPSYSFRSENLSSHPEIEVRIEDHYYARTDAAVVFELYDRRTSQRRYIYHGNDGTGLPWNDTAQLDYTLAEVRQAVVNEIINIARRIPIIRFDAAMTLAKKHYQRLWFPLPGSGGDIPTRSEYSLSREEFDNIFPREFWKDVIDRVNEEVPDTLLLAEAFWMMEGYFVRNLGMHRVYNSAFMHMMMREENAAFRKTIYNTLEYDKRILKRYVNFMSNPDEETAIDQFGDDNKYFGVCVLMCSLPGLPMFGHGQFEGFQEKYGMEFAFPQQNEEENRYLIHRHEKEIFPLLKQRHLFAEADNFRLFDFYDEYGNLNENVIAFGNYNQEKHTLIFYNNSYDQTWGRINEADDFKVNGNGIKEVNKIKWCDILGLNFGPDKFLIFHDLIFGSEYLRPVDEIMTSGFEMSLQGYEYHIFSGFKVENDSDGKLKIVYEQLGKNGSDSIELMRKRINLRPLHSKIRDLFSPGMIKNQELLINGDLKNPDERKFFLKKQLFPAISEFHKLFMKMAHLPEWTEERLIRDTLTYFKKAEKAIVRYKPYISIIAPGSLIAIWTLLREVRKRTQENGLDLIEIINLFLIDEPLQEVFAVCCPQIAPRHCLDIVYLCLDMEDYFDEIIASDFNNAAAKLLQLDKVKSIMEFHNYNGSNWIRKESLELLMSSLERVNRIRRCEGKNSEALKDMELISTFFLKLTELAAECGYNYDLLLQKLVTPDIREEL